MLRVTLDTNVLKRDLERLRAAANGLAVELAYTTVTLRENVRHPGREDIVVNETGVYDESLYDSGAVYADSGSVVDETAVIGEWRLGMAVLGDDEAPSRLETILRVLGDGSFPPLGGREELTSGQRRQLRDAMILEAHVRDGRHVLVSNDIKAFGRKKRMTLEALFSTRVMTVDEFCSGVYALAASVG